MRVFELWVPNARPLRVESLSPIMQVLYGWPGSRFGVPKKHGTLVLKKRTTYIEMPDVLKLPHAEMISLDVFRQKYTRTLPNTVNALNRSKSGCRNLGKFVRSCKSEARILIRSRQAPNSERI